MKTTKPKSYHDGARAERSATIARLRRRIREEDLARSGAVAMTLAIELEWHLNRRLRYEKRPGGLGRKKKA